MNGNKCGQCARIATSSCPKIGKVNRFSDACEQFAAWNYTYSANTYGGSAMLNIHAPFTCPTCREQFAVSRKIGVGQWQSFIPRHCPNCGAEVVVYANSRTFTASNTRTVR